MKLKKNVATQFTMMMVLAIAFEFSFQSFRFIRTPIIFCLGMAVIIAVYDVVLLKNQGVTGILELVSCNKIMFIAWGSYFLWDIIRSIGHINIFEVIDKYQFLIIYSVIFVLICLCQFIYKEYRTNIIDCMLSGTVLVSGIIGGIAYVNYFIPLQGYTLKYNISLERDYNQFAEFMLIAIVSFYLLMVREEREKKALQERIIIGIVTTFFGTLIILSSSRRTILELGVVLVVLSVRYCYKKRKHMIMNIVMIGSSVVLIWAGSNVMQQYRIELLADLQENVQENIGVEQSIGEDNSSSGDEVKENDVPVIESTRTGESVIQGIKNKEFGTSLRIEIYKKALSEISKFEGKEWIIGKGEGTSREIYGNVQGEYPHNLWLEDFLNGGIIKLLLELVVLAVTLFNIIKVLRENLDAGITVGLIFSVIFGHLLISGQYSLLADVYIYWNILILFLMNTIRKECGDKKCWIIAEEAKTQ